MLGSRIEALANSLTPVQKKLNLLKDKKGIPYTQWLSLHSAALALDAAEVALDAAQRYDEDRRNA